MSPGALTAAFRGVDLLALPLTQTYRDDDDLQQSLEVVLSTRACVRSPQPLYGLISVVSTTAQLESLQPLIPSEKAVVIMCDAFRKWN